MCLWIPMWWWYVTLYLIHTLSHASQVDPPVGRLVRWLVGIGIQLRIQNGRYLAQSSIMNIGWGLWWLSSSIRNDARRQDQWLLPTFQRALHHHHRYHYRYHGYDIYFNHPAIHRHPSINSQVGIQGQQLPASIFHEAGNHAGSLELLIMLNPESRTWHLWSRTFIRLSLLTHHNSAAVSRSDYFFCCGIAIQIFRKDKLWQNLPVLVRYNLLERIEISFLIVFNEIYTTKQYVVCNIWK